MKALIAPNDKIPQYVSGWTTVIEDDGSTTLQKEWTDISNSYRVAEVEETEFNVAEPLFWVDCSDSVEADLWYYDTSDSTIKEIAPLNVAKPS